MPRRPILLALGLAMAVLLAYGLASAGSEAAPATFSVAMAAGRNLNSIAYNITLNNPTANAIGDVFVAVPIPSGTQYVDKSATAGGRVEVNDVVWLVATVPPRGNVVLTFKVNATGPEVGATQASVRWLRPQEATAVSAEVRADFQLIKVKGINIRELREPLPAGKVALTTTAGKGHQENQIGTSGLPNVGTGEYVYLEGVSHDNLENSIVSWSWQLQERPLGSTAALENTQQQVARLSPDRVGEYVIAVTATNAKGQQMASSLTITAGKFAGISLCASCHDGSVATKDIVSSFVETGHADKFEATWGSYSKDSDYCIRCHTLAYNEQATAGGMADAARAAGWNPQQGSVLAWLKANRTLEEVKADPAMGRTINIQCESCHGPGATAHTGAKSYDPGVCGQCHPQTIEWRESRHAIVNPETATRATCARCHTGQGYVEEWVRGKTLVMADEATPGKPANVPSVEQQSGIACATCHDPHAVTDRHEGPNGLASNQLRIVGEVKAPAGWSVDADLAATCVRCHANNRTPATMAQFIAGDYPRATHENTQADVLFGKGFYAYDGRLATSNSFHTTLKEGCISCHMAANPVADPGPDGQKGTRDDVKVLSVGGHSWAMKGEWQGKEFENTDACATCHAGATTFNRPAAGDYDGNGKIEGVQDEVKGLLAVLATELPRDRATGQVLSGSVSAANTSEAQRKAMWNYFLVLRDGSLGVHNTSFAVQLLQKTYKELTGRDVPGATLR